jgi:hypothetical protein
MVVLGGEEFLVRLDLGDDRRIVDPHSVELGNVGLGDPRLLGAGREDRRAIVGAAVGALAVELGRIVGDRDLQGAAVADLSRVEADPDGLGHGSAPLVSRM